MTTTQPGTAGKRRRRSLAITSALGDPFDRATTLAGDQDLAQFLSNLLDRYYAIIHRSIPRLSDTELCAIFDALTEHWDPTPANIANLPREVMTGITNDFLHTKWQIDPNALRTRLDRLGFPERAAIAELTSCYWQLASDDEPPQTTIARMKSLFRPDPKQQPTSARPRRISVNHFPAIAGTSTGTDDDDPTPPGADLDQPGEDDNPPPPIDNQPNGDHPATPAQLSANLDIDDSSPGSGQDADPHQTPTNGADASPGTGATNSP